MHWSKLVFNRCTKGRYKGILGRVLDWSLQRTTGYLVDKLEHHFYQRLTLRGQGPYEVSLQKILLFPVRGRRRRTRLVRPVKTIGGNV